MGSYGWPEFVAFADHVNAVQREVEGAHALTRSPAQVLLAQQHQDYLEKPVWLALDGDLVVGSARGRRPLDDGAAALFAQVAVAPDRRRQGIGTELLDRVVEHARHWGCTTLQSFVVHPSDPLAPLVPAASGSGGVPETNPETRFLVRHGFTLEQASLGSTLALPVDPDHLDQVENELFRFERLVADDHELAAAIGRREVDPSLRAKLVDSGRGGRRCFEGRLATCPTLEGRVARCV